jgi:hypothetical protein
VKIQNLTRGLIATLVLASPIVGAEDYPAANFQPTVIYSDIDKDSKGASTSTSKAETSQPDSNYPAANFQPTVVYSDSDYQYKTSTASTKKTVNSSSSSVSANEETTVAEESENDSMVTLLGLVALAIVGFVLLKRKSLFETSEKPVRRARGISKIKKTAQVGGATGVARYLSKNMPELSSVAQYLKNKKSIQASGVSKYMAKRIVTAKAAAVAKRTGVEKYLRDRG